MLYQKIVAIYFREINNIYKASLEYKITYSPLPCHMLVLHRLPTNGKRPWTVHFPKKYSVAILQYIIKIGKKLFVLWLLNTIRLDLHEHTKPI